MTPEFVKDLQDGKHPNMARQALSHVFTDGGVFKDDRNDHQYDGIPDGWIRWVSMGGVGLRVIYIRKKDVVYLYRVVGKSDEDGLKAPTSLVAMVGVGGLPAELQATFGEGADLIRRRLLKNTSPEYLREALRGMYHLAHSEIILVTPKVSLPLFRHDGEIGRFLFRAIEDGTRAILITAPPLLEEIRFYEDLAARNLEIYFVQNLQSRLFVFKVDEHRNGNAQEVPQPTAILGSAELTHHGLDIGDVGRNEELCFKFPKTHFSAFYDYALELTKSGTDLQGHKIKLQIA